MVTSAGSFKNVQVCDSHWVTMLKARGIAIRVNIYRIKVSHNGFNVHEFPHSPSLNPPLVRHTADK